MKPMKLILPLAAAVLIVSVAAWALQSNGGPKVESSTQIFLVKSDGTGLRKLTSGPSSSVFSWAPDGRRIAYSSSGRIMVADVGGSSRRLVTTTHGLFAWSPKRDEIAFFAPGREGGRPKITIKTVKPDGSPPRTLTSRRNASVFKSDPPVWSPSGERLTYAEQLVRRTIPAIEGPADITVVSRRGRRIRMAVKGDEWDPQWSPEGRSILFTRQRSQTGGIGLWRSSPKGHGLQPVVKRVLGGAHAAWSPDGRTIAFTGVFTRTGGNHLYLVPAEGGASRQVAAGEATEFSPAWSPDGSLLAFGDFDGHIRVVRPDGAGDHAIATLSNATFYDLAWSPDGRWIAFAAAKRPAEG